MIGSESRDSTEAIGSRNRERVCFARREFLRFVAGSPLLLSAIPAAAAERLFAAVEQKGGVAPETELLASAADAINVFDFEAVAKRNLLSAHYTYLSMGIQDEFTLRANREAFGQVQLRPRRLVDVRELDTSTEILGTELSCPIVLAPAGAQKAFHPEAELAVARAARRPSASSNRPVAWVTTRFATCASKRPTSAATPVVGAAPRWLRSWPARRRITTRHRLPRSSP